MIYTIPTHLPHVYDRQSIFTIIIQTLVLQAVAEWIDTRALHAPRPAGGINSSASSRSYALIEKYLYFFVDRYKWKEVYLYEGEKNEWIITGESLIVFVLQLDLLLFNF